MRPSLLLLLLLLLLLSIGSSSTSTYVGCGTVGVGGFAAFACIPGEGDDPCDYIVTLQVTVLLAADDSPVHGATVYINTGPPDAINTRLTDASGQVFWDDTSFLTGFSAECGGQDVGTVEPYDEDTVFNYDLMASAPGLAPAFTVFTVDRMSRDLAVLLRLASF